jgi:glycosyltransferase involved in cell wall biosynthesis
MARHVRAVQPHIVHAHNPTSLHYAVLAALLTHARVVVTVHGDQETHARRGSRIEWRAVSRTAVVSDSALRGLQLPIAPAKLTVIRNGIDSVESTVEERAKYRREFGAEGSCVGALVARIDGRKGHATLLESLRTMKDRGVSVLINIVGEGALRPALEQRASDLSLDGSTVRFLGLRSDVDAVLKGSDFFVLPSDTEGLPLSVLEAMSHGLPVVASCVGGIPEVVVDGEHGVLVPPGDSDALARAIGRICQDQSFRERLGRAALSRARTAFSLDHTVAQYNELYRVARL